MGIAFLDDGKLVYHTVKVIAKGKSPQQTLQRARDAVVRLIGDLEQMSVLRRMASPFNVNAFAIECLAEALADRQFVADYVRQVIASREWLRKELEKLQHEEVRVRLLHAAIGGITESDVQLALTSPLDTIIVGFNAVPDERAKALAEEKGIQIREYNIIYNLTADVKAALEGKGFKLAMGALNVVRLAQVGARAVGKASHVLELMTAYANDRQQFGRRIGDFQMVQQMLADSVIEINAARLMVLQAAWMIDAGQDARDVAGVRWVRVRILLQQPADELGQPVGQVGADVPQRDRALLQVHPHEDRRDLGDERRPAGQ